MTIRMETGEVCHSIQWMLREIAPSDNCICYLQQAPSDLKRPIHFPPSVKHVFARYFYNQKKKNRHVADRFSVSCVVSPRDSEAVAFGSSEEWPSGLRVDMETYNWVVITLEFVFFRTSESLCFASPPYEKRSSSLIGDPSDQLTHRSNNPLHETNPKPLNYSIEHTPANNTPDIHLLPNSPPNTDICLSCEAFNVTLSTLQIGPHHTPPNRHGFQTNTNTSTHINTQITNAQTNTQIITQINTQTNTQINTQINTQTNTQINTQQNNQTNTQTNTQQKNCQNTTQTNYVQIGQKKCQQIGDEKCENINEKHFENDPEMRPPHQNTQSCREKGGALDKGTEGGTNEGKNEGKNGENEGKNQGKNGENEGKNKGKNMGKNGEDEGTSEEKKGENEMKNGENTGKMGENNIEKNEKYGETSAEKRPVRRFFGALINTSKEIDVSEERNKDIFSQKIGRKNSGENNRQNKWENEGNTEKQIQPHICPTIFLGQSGTASLSGVRTYNEDRVIFYPKISPPELLLPALSYFAVYDGHNGEGTVNFVASNLHRLLPHQSAFAHGDLGLALKQAFKEIEGLLEQNVLKARKNPDLRTRKEDDILAMNSKFLTPYDWDLDFTDDISPVTSGTTACVCLLTAGCYTIANLGDSRCVLSRRGHAEPMTVDHRLSCNASEQNRVISEGAQFDYDGYLEGSVSVSRGFGVFDKVNGGKLKGLSGEPDIFHGPIHEDDAFILIACDGVFDVMTNQEAVTVIHSALRAGKDLKGAAEALCDLAYSRRSLDNLSAVVVALKNADDKLWQGTRMERTRTTPAIGLNSLSKT